MALGDSRARARRGVVSDDEPANSELLQRARRRGNEKFLAALRGKRLSRGFMLRLPFLSFFPPLGNFFSS